MTKHAPSIFRQELESNVATRRRFLQSGLAAGVSISALTGIVPTVGQVRRATAQDEKQTIRFQSFQSGAVVEKWEEQFAEFEQQTGIKVEHEFVTNAEQLEKILLDAVGGQLPDVAMVSANWHRALATRGLFNELTAGQFKELDLADFWPALIGVYTYGDKVFGIPTDLDLQLLFYNADIFESAGVAPPTESWTWDDLHNSAVATTSDAGGGKTYGYSIPDYPTTEMIAWSYGGALLSEVDGVDVSTIDEPGGRRAMELVGAMLTDGSAMAPGTDVAVESGRVAMYVAGPWAARYIYGEVDFAWDAVPVPMGDERVVLAWGSTLATFATTEKADAVNAFYDFFLSPELQYQRADDWAWFPPGKSATTMDGFMDPSVMQLNEAQKQFVIESVAVGRSPIITVDQNKLYRVFDEQLSLVASGEKEIDQAITDIDAEWTAILES